MIEEIQDEVSPPIIIDKLGGEKPIFEIYTPDINVWTALISVDQGVELPVVVDTATDLVAIKSKECAKCKGLRLDRISKEYSIDQTIQIISYGQ